MVDWKGQILKNIKLDLCQLHVENYNAECLHILNENRCICLFKQSYKVTDSRLRRLMQPPTSEPVLYGLVKTFS